MRVPASARRSLVALAVAVLATVAVVRFGATPYALAVSAFVGVLVVLAAIDVERRILPNAIVLPAAALVLAGTALFAPDRLVEASVATGALFLAFLVAALAYPGGIGMGDVKLALLLGAFLGADVVVAVLLGTTAAALAGLALIARRGLAERKTAIPLGPFLAFGAIAVLLA